MNNLYLFFADNNLYIRSGKYNVSSLPQGVLVYEGELPKCQEPNKLVYIDNQVKVLTPIAWTNHRIKVGEITLSDSQMVNDKGDIVHKSQLQLLKEATKENAYDYLYKRISDKAGIDIVSGFSSEVLGSEHLYDSTIQDQMNLKDALMTESKSRIRCMNVMTGKKTFVDHTSEQIKELFNDFLRFKNIILYTADNEKLLLREFMDRDKTIDFILDKLQIVVE